MGLNGRPRGIQNALTHQLKCPLCDSSYGILILDDFAKREGCHDHHRVRLEVVMQLPPSDQDSVQELLDLGVASLGIEQDFTNKVYEMLLFTPKFGKKNVGTRSFQDCINQGIDCIRIDIS